MARNKKHVPKPFETPKANEHFTAIYDSMLFSDIFKSLSTSTQMIYILLKSQYKGIYSGDKVILTYRQLKEFGFTSRTISKAIQELSAKGFIEVYNKGIPVNNNLKQKSPNEYTFSNKWYIK